MVRFCQRDLQLSKYVTWTTIQVKQEPDLRHVGRPMGLTIWKTRNSVFKNLRFVQSQMWYATRRDNGETLLTTTIGP